MFDFDRTSLLGTGMESEVYTVPSERLPPGLDRSKEYVLKIYNKNGSPTFEKELLKKGNIQSNFQNILVPLACFSVTSHFHIGLNPIREPEEYPAILFEKFQNDLYDEIGSVDYDKETILVFSRDIFRGVRELHRIGYIHNDIKPENIGVVLDAKGKKTLKICDFGLCTKIEEKRDNSFFGSKAYIPLSKNMKEGNDIHEFDRDSFAAICILFVLAVKGFPFDEREMEQEDRNTMEQRLKFDRKTVREKVEHGECPKEVENVFLKLELDPNLTKFKNVKTDECCKLLGIDEENKKRKREDEGDGNN